MATHLDLEEQEQLDPLKAFWKQYGNLITWVLIIGFGAHCRVQRLELVAARPGIEGRAPCTTSSTPPRRPATPTKAARVFADLKDRYARTAFAQQAGLLAAKTAVRQGRRPTRRTGHAGVGRRERERRRVPHHRAAAARRRAGSMQKKYDEALKQLDGATAPPFQALVADRRGDILLAQGKSDEAKAAYRKAWDAMADASNYRRLVEAKLTSLGAAPTAPSAAAGARKRSRQVIRVRSWPALAAVLLAAGARAPTSRSRRRSNR